MKISVIYEPAVRASFSPYRLRDEDGRELDWANAFLDAQCLRQLSPRSLRIYAYDLLHFARWIEPLRLPLAEITESTIVDYVRFQLEQDPKPTPQTVNHRLGVVRCGYRFHTGKDIPAGSSGHFQRSCRFPRSPSPHSSSLSASNSSRIPSPPRKQLIIAWAWCVAVIVFTRAKIFLLE